MHNAVACKVWHGADHRAATRNRCAARGYEEYSGSNRGALKTVQMVWANCNPLNGGGESQGNRTQGRRAAAQLLD